MPKKTPAVPTPSMPTWETLDEFVRVKIQESRRVVGWLSPSLAP